MTAAVFLVLLATAALYVGLLRARMRRDWSRDGRLGPLTAVLIYPAYLLHLAALAVAAWTGLWALPAPTGPALAVGAILAATGAVLLVAGLVRFASVGQVSGTTRGQLVTGGIYRYSRNPQYVGWGLVVTGLAVASRSGAALTAAAAYWALMAGYLPLEEGVLAAQFGDAYRDYRRRTHRWFGPPRTVDDDG